MTHGDAITFLTEWQKRPDTRCDYVVRDNNEWRTTRDGDAVVKILTSDQYELDTLRDVAADVRVRCKYATIKLAHVLEAYDAQLDAAPRTHDDNPVLTRMGHGCIVAMDDGQSYGVVDIDCTDPGIWVLQPYQHPVTHQQEKPVWTYMGQRRVRAGTATPVGEEQARTIKARWWKMEQEGQFHSEGPWKFYRPWTPPKDVSALRFIFMQLCHSRQPRYGERTDAESFLAVMEEKRLVGKLVREARPADGSMGIPETDGMAAIDAERQRRREAIVPGSAIGTEPEGEALF